MVAIWLAGCSTGEEVYSIKKETVRYPSVADCFDELDAEQRLYRRVR